MADLSFTDTVSKVSTVPETLQEPTRTVTFGFQSLLYLANIACWVVVLPVGLILLPTQVAALDPINKFSNLAIITAVGGLTALLTNPLVGALSDRTTSNLGRRYPWLIVGTAFSAVTLALLAHATSIVMLVVAWALFHVAINTLLAALAAIVPDQVPLGQRATVSAIVSLSLPLGGVMGSLLVTKFIKSPQFAYYLLIGILLIGMSLFLLVMRDKPLPRGAAPQFRLGTLLTTFWINPAKYPDFAWAWVTRFLIYLSYFAALGYLLYFLHDVVRYEQIFPGQVVAQGVATFQIILTATLLFGSIIVGRLSDIFQCRKIFVIGSSFVIVLAFLILAFFQSWFAVELAAAILGTGFGGYLGVDLALITQVLPSARDRAKDLGVINIANTLPQVIGPTVAALTISIFRSYSILFILAAVLASLGALLIQLIKGVR